MTATLGEGRARRFSIPDRSRHLFRNAGRHSRRSLGRLPAICAGRYPDEFREARTERTQRRAPDFEAHFGHREFPTTQQRHRTLDPSGHEIRVRRFTICAPKLTTEVPGRHVYPAGEVLDVQRIRILTVDSVANTAQHGEITQVSFTGGTGTHLCNRARHAPECAGNQGSRSAALPFSVAEVCSPL